MGWKKIGRAVLFPHIAVLLLFLPVCAVGLVYSMRRLDETDPVRIGFYVLSFYTLTIWCVRVPKIIRFFKTFKEENRYTSLWFGNHRLRMNVTLIGNVLWNGTYGALQFGLGVYHGSAWFYSLAAYYASLAVMRFFLVRHTLRHEPGKEQQRELVYYRTCGWVFLLMNLALSAMMFYMIQENRVTRHHEITTIAMAAYTFTTLTVAVINVFHYRKYNSPAMSAAKGISLAAACVSMLSLENTMLVTFSDESMTARTRQLFLALSGGAISVWIVVMAIYMIVQADRKMKALGEAYYGK